jgi:hypothetical protein
MRDECLFQDTLPRFLKSYSAPVAFLHIDCDLYSSTRFVLKALRYRLRDTVVVFDEFSGPAAYDDNEGRAFTEFVRESGLRATVLGQPHACGAAFRLSGHGG